MLALQYECQPPSMGRMKTAHSTKPGDELFHLMAVEKGLDFKGKCKQINPMLLFHVEDNYPSEQLGEDHALACNIVSPSVSDGKGLLPATTGPWQGPV